MDSEYQQVCILLRMHFGEYGPFHEESREKLISAGLVSVANEMYLELTDEGRRTVATIFVAAKDLVKHGC